MTEPVVSLFPTALDSDASLFGDAVNLRSFTLSAGVTDADTSIPVSESMTGINAPCYIRCESELIYAGAIAGGAFTSCIREVGGTTKAAHAIGKAVYVVYSANHFNQLKRAIVAIETALGTGLANAKTYYITIPAVGPTTDWPADSSANIYNEIPCPFTGTIVSIRGDVQTAGITGVSIVDVNLNGTTIMATHKLKWDSTEKSTATYSGTAAAISTTAITAGDLLSVDIDTNHTGTVAKGLVITIGILKT